MRKISYKKLNIQNFLSVGNDTVSIEFQDGLNLITGNNIDNPERRNGSGKSSVIEAFFYALYGKTIRDIKLEFIINNVTKGKGLVELEFDVETDTSTKSYKVTRQVKPSKVELWENGTDITKDSIANTNRFICDLIGSNATLCKSCDILSLSDNIPFMAKKPEEKKKFIEDIFSLEVFSLMLKDLKEEIKNNKTNSNLSAARIEEINNTLETIQRQKESLQKQIEEREAVLALRRKEIQTKIDNTQSQLDNLVVEDVSTLVADSEKLHDAWRKIDGKLSKLVFEISNQTATKNVKDKELKKASTVGGATCGSCLQDIPSTHLEHIEEIKQTLEGEIEVIDNTIDKLNAEKQTWNTKKTKIQQTLGQYKDQIDKAKSDSQKMESLKTLIAEYQKSMDNLDEDSQQSSNSTDIFTESLDETVERMSKETESLESLKQTGQDLDTCKFILGEEGVKSFVIKRLLGMLNSGIQKYITDLGMTMRCKFDEYFDEKITNDKGKDISYWNFSGGERRTVDLACAWAFKDLKRKISGVSSNVEFFDEVFDSAFDEHGLDLLIEVVKNRIDKNELSTYAISHRKETMRHISGETVILEKENGVTRRVYIADS